MLRLLCGSDKTSLAKRLEATLCRVQVCSFITGLGTTIITVAIDERVGARTLMILSLIAVTAMMCVATTMLAGVVLFLLTKLAGRHVGAHRIG
jgi:hypothetical protein